MLYLARRAGAGRFARSVARVSAGRARLDDVAVEARMALLRIKAELKAAAGNDWGGWESCR
jgi:hypothetical protein